MDKITNLDIIHHTNSNILNEIRDKDNPTLPMITCFERFIFDEYHPIQARFTIVNPSGLNPGQTGTMVMDHTY